MLRLVKLEGRWGFAWGYQNKKGQLVVPPYFPEAREFSEGMAAVKFISSWGYIDEQGKVAISPMFDDADSFSDGVARVKGEHLSFAISINTCRVKESGNYTSSQKCMMEWK